ncbi:MAG: START domain-containing protein [Gammaproteobacteria bacterium]|uniref:START domain protein n=1 Tax=Marinobacter litoralis TaxID=187981 RepID=A0A3M2RJZ8_9GAMM|nr:START domain-containing protein [Marinobacter litoralis]MBR9869765.1 START domain-containing protein [Gammaproteobacteria bacterium]RMJ05479.1 START domain protein [Marinobacter litoralis]
MTITRVRGTMGILFGFAALLLAVPAFADDHSALPPENSEHWALQKQVDNIRIYTMDQPGSGFRAFKAVADLNVRINNLMAVMINPESCKEWVHNCTESFAFGKGTFHDRYAYSVNDMPWPVSDRDYVLRIRTRGNADTGEIIMDLNATPGMRAEANSRVRVDVSNTLYRFTPTEQGTHMVWVQHTEPNGALPEWLVNQLVIDIPVKSLKALEAVAGKEKYQGYRIQWGADGNIEAVVPHTP